MVRTDFRTHACHDGRRRDDGLALRAARRAHRAIGSLWAGWALAGALALGIAPDPSRAAQLSGVVLPDVSTVAGVELPLNGIGLRTVFIVKAWVAGLYVPAITRDPAELLAQKGPHRLRMKMLVDISPDRMMKNFQDGLQANLSSAQLAALKPQVDQLSATLQSIGHARKGDQLDIDHVDGAVRVSINGQARGEPIASDDFFAALLKVFIGERPVDKDLKKGLMGG